MHWTASPEGVRRSAEVDCSDRRMCRKAVRASWDGKGHLQSIPPIHCNHEVGRAGADLADAAHNLRLAMISGFKTGFEIVKVGSDPAAGAKRVFKLCPGPNGRDGRQRISMVHGFLWMNSGF